MERYILIGGNRKSTENRLFWNTFLIDMIHSTSFRLFQKSLNVYPGFEITGAPRLSGLPGGERHEAFRVAAGYPRGNEKTL